MKTFFIVGVFLSFFLEFLLLTKKNKSLSDKILAVWMFIIGFHLFSYYLDFTTVYLEHPQLIGLTTPFPLLHGPILYLYVLFSIRKSQKLIWTDMLHFLPVVLTILYMIPFIFTYPAEKKLLLMQGQTDDYKGFLIIQLLLITISGLVYPIISYLLVNKHHKLINANFSYEEKINLDWLKYCIWGLGIIYIVVAITSILEPFGVFGDFNVDTIIFFFVTLFIFSLGYFGIRHQGIFANSAQRTKEVIIPANESGYKNSGLKKEEAEALNQKLLKLMVNDKPYLEPKLTLSILADKLNTSTNYLSQTINQFQKVNFYDFVNTYRIEEFKYLVTDPKNKNFSLLALAYDSGFNSKSSFNQVFKKQTGLTPSQFLTQIG